MNNPLTQTKAVNLKQLMDRSKKEIAAALPRHVTADRIMRIALTEARKTPKLLECDQLSFLGAVIQAAQLGLEPGSALGHCWLIPYGKEVNFQIGYRGMLELAMRSEKVSHISARAVFDGDEFEWEFGLSESLKHKPCPNPGELTYVYCVLHLKNGCKMFDVMSREEVEKVRQSSKSGNNGPWKTHFVEMAKKSVIRRLFKYMPVSVELAKGISLDERDEAGLSQDNQTVIETTGAEVKESPINKAQALQAKLSEQEALEPEYEEVSPEFEAALSETPDPRTVK